VIAPGEAGIAPDATPSYDLGDWSQAPMTTAR
jgi:hypothetical protein